MVPRSLLAPLLTFSSKELARSEGDLPISKTCSNHNVTRRPPRLRGRLDAMVRRSSLLLPTWRLRCRGTYVALSHSFFRINRLQSEFIGIQGRLHEVMVFAFAHEAAGTGIRPRTTAADLKDAVMLLHVKRDDV